jgi:hypothetical protein
VRGGERAGRGQRLGAAGGRIQFDFPVEARPRFGAGEQLGEPELCGPVVVLVV